MANLLLEISTAELLTCDLDDAVFTVTYEYRPLDRSDNERAVLALVNADLFAVINIHCTGRLT